MAREFNSIEACLRFVENQCQSGLTEVGTDIFDTLVQNVNSTVYSRDPGEYERTNQLINSISRRDNSHMTEVYFADGTGHTTLYGSVGMGLSPDSPVYIPQWVNDGQTWNQPPAFFYERTIEDITRGAIPRFVNVMKDFLQSRGIDAEYD